MPTRPTRPVTFICTWCGATVTEERVSGPTPRYCAPCYAEARKKANRDRVRAYRVRQWEADPYTHRPPGRRVRKD